jgi:cysteinyl-tRNA synthetase
MTDYFGYDVHFVMNITDIDDKVSLDNDVISNDLIHQRLDHHPRSTEAFARKISNRNGCSVTGAP